MADTAGEARRLDGEDLLAVLVATVRVGRYERMLAVAAAQLRRLAGRHAEGEADDAGANGHRGAEEGAVAAAFGGEAVEVDLRDDQGEVEAEAFRFAEHHAVLGDEAMAAVDDVGARFAGAGGSVDVSGEAAGGLRLHEVAAVGGLGEELVAGRKVAEQGGTGEGLGSARGLHGPEVFANLDAEHAVRHIGRLEEEVGAEGDFLAEEFDFGDRGDPGRGEPALLVELARVGEVGLRDNPEDLAAGDRDGHVEEASVDLQRGADEGGEAKLGRGLANLPQGLYGAVQEGPLAEEVTAAIPGQAEFGEDDDFHPFLGGFFQSLDD